MDYGHSGCVASRVDAPQNGNIRNSPVFFNNKTNHNPPLYSILLSFGRVFQGASYEIQKIYLATRERGHLLDHKKRLIHTVRL